MKKLFESSAAKSTINIDLPLHPRSSLMRNGKVSIDSSVNNILNEYASGSMDVNVSKDEDSEVFTSIINLKDISSLQNNIFNIKKFDNQDMILRFSIKNEKNFINLQSLKLARGADSDKALIKAALNYNKKFAKVEN